MSLDQNDFPSNQGLDSSASSGGLVAGVNPTSSDAATVDARRESESEALQVRAPESAHDADP